VGSRTEPRELKKLVRQRTERINVPSERRGALEDRDWLQKLYLRLIPFVYDYPDVPLEKLLEYSTPRLVQAETSYLLSRLHRVRHKRDVAVVSRGEEDLLLPVRPGFDPRKVPLVACWCDGGFYTPKERRPGYQNTHKLREMGLPDATASYASFRAIIFSPSVGHPSWKEGPIQTNNVPSSNEAEIKAAEIALSAVIARLEQERGVPPVAQFHLILYTDSQSLVKALNESPAHDESLLLASVRSLAQNLAEIHPIWQPRRLIKQRLGH
jgi:hypothetical protein